MAPPANNLLISCILFCCLIAVSEAEAQPSFRPKALILPVTKDPSTLQYLTQINQRTPLVPVKLALDLGGQYLWVDCEQGYVSSSYKPAPCGSAQCSLANSKSCTIATTPGACVVGAQNGVVGSRAAGQLAEGAFAVGSTDGSGFLFSCGSGFLLSGLASGAVGVMGLGRTRISPPAQFASAFGFRRRFAVCLSSNGFLAFGDSPTESILGPEISRSLFYTPLVVSSGRNSPAGHEYFINLKSIRVNGERVSLGKDRIGLAKLSTTVPYALMETSVYRAFTEAYLKAAAANNMSIAKPISPFSYCFRSTKVGPAVPQIDLVLQSSNVYWRIFGANSMVQVKSGVLCLGFVDGGVNPRTAIVIGGHQVEDNLLQFDLAASRLGFSSSLLSRQTTCSNFNFTSTA
ncbi:unnamed protein product [Linum tenue]|uniref:Peptidase A1 domain-containing protein n=1 Tax=Linum tenue TaxID=586396 RepID=A0AAV0P582_9ROSI|nr:unnamed protein product [Linum tenue]